MTMLEQHYEGQADGTDLTIANSSTYGDSPASSVLAANGTVRYSTADYMHGSRSLLLTPTDYTTSPTQLYVGLGGFTSTTIAARCYQKITGLPTIPQRILLLNGVNGANLGGINLYSNGTIAATDINGAVLSQSSSSTQVLDPNTWYRLEMAWNLSTTVGSYKAAVYVGDATAPWFSYTSATNLNTGSVAGVEVRVGKASGTGPITGSWKIDDFAVNTASSTFIGPYVQAGPSIATALTPGLIKLDATGSQPVGTGALTYSISPSTGVTQSPDGVFYIPQGSSAAAYTLSVAEAGGGTSSRVVTIPALTSASSSQTTVMTQKWISGAWR